MLHLKKKAKTFCKRFQISIFSLAFFVFFAELHRCAVFCLLQLGREIFDTDMVIVDRTLTDICFDNTIVL